MRILHIGKYFSPYQGGIESFQLALMDEMARRGAAQHALVHHERFAVQSKTIRTVEFGQAYVVEKVRCFGQLMYMPVAPGFLWHMYRAIRQFWPDVIHLHMPNPVGLFLPWLVPKSLPILVQWHSDVLGVKSEAWLDWAYRLYRPLEQRLLKRAQAVTISSQAYYQASEALFRWQDRCHVIPLGLPDPFVSAHIVSEPSSEVADPSDLTATGVLKVLAIGRFTAYKGFQYLLEAVAQLEDVDLTIVGDGPLRAGMVQWVQSRNLAKRVHLPGTVSDAGKQQFLLNCDVFCLPSIARSESFGVVLLEAMAAAKPCMVSDVKGSGMTTIVEAGKNGYHFQPESAEAIQTVLKTLLQDREKLISMGLKGREKFEGDYEIAKVADAYQRLYQGLRDD